MLTQSELKVAKVVHREVHLHGNYLSGGKIPVASGYDAGGVFPANLVLAGILLVRVSTHTTSSSVKTPLVLWTKKIFYYTCIIILLLYIIIPKKKQ